MPGNKIFRIQNLKQRLPTFFGGLGPDGPGERDGNFQDSQLYQYRNTLEHCKLPGWVESCRDQERTRPRNVNISSTLRDKATEEAKDGSSRKMKVSSQKAWIGFKACTIRSYDLMG
ncbi:hypothetical protein Leryth_026659 [Lithospermum erythrorhizon]|nr:hypothetical protein Leryth_026659 [Lithospermum erythrorhizon]